MYKKFVSLLSLSLLFSLSLLAKLPDGPNHSQKAPKLTSAKIEDSKTHVKGHLKSVEDTHFIIQFFNNLEKRDNITEGAVYLGEIRVKTDHHGKVSFKARLPKTADHSYISASATRLDGDTETDTSEFSKNVTVR